MELCDSLMKWLETFKISRQVNTRDDLTDGVALGQILNQIAPGFFSQIWLSKIKADTGSNWRLKVSNLKKIVKTVQEFYSQAVGHQLNDSQLPDVTAIVERSDAKELGILLQLVLGCAVNSDDKHEYIRRIMQMEESVQLSVMKAIQELMAKEAQSQPQDAKPDASDQQKNSSEEMRKLREERDIYAQRCHGFDQQVMVLLEEKSHLQAEIDRLSERLNQAESLEDPSALKDWPNFLLSTPAGRRYQLLQRQAEQLQEDFYRSETAREEFRIKFEELEREVFDLQQKNEKLTSLTEEARNLKDEVDVLRHNSEKVGKLESSLETYKKKLEEMNDVKMRLKMVEEYNTSYMQQNMELEEELKRNAVFKTQVELYKKQLQDAQTKSSDETKRADKAEFESKRMQEKLTALQREKERLTEERNSLKEMNEELRCLQNQQTSENVDMADNPSSTSDLELMSLPSALRAQFLRLQHENKLLKVQTSSSEDDQILKTMLDDANARNHDLECEIRRLNQQIMELEAKAEDAVELRLKLSSEGDSTNQEMRKKLKEQVEKCRNHEADVQLQKNRCEDMETKLQASADEIQDLNEKLKKKDVEMKEMEEKYKKYLEKAKQLIKNLDPKFNPQGSDLQVVKSQLNEKDRYIQSLERNLEKAQTSNQEEEKLMVTAWYNLASNLHRKTVDDRLSMSNLGQQSFLSRQRQAHVRRTPGTPSGTNITSPTR